jgi:DNA primase
VSAKLDPAAFTIDTVPRRLERLGDLWAKEMRRRNSIERALARV